jgi:hypothetical protein
MTLLLPQQGAHSVERIAEGKFGLNWAYSKYSTRSGSELNGLSQAKISASLHGKSRSTLLTSKLDSERELARIILSIQTFMSDIVARYPITTTVQP